MLKSNSKKAIENIRRYIINGVSPDYDPKYNYIEEAIKDNESGVRNIDVFSLVKYAVREVFYEEKMKHDKRRMTRQELFEDWASGLPSFIDFDYYYHCNAREILGEILEETPEEINKFSQTEAEKKLTYLIYREIFK